MADELYVLNEEVAVPSLFTSAPSTGTFNTATGVNPRAISINASNSTTIGINCYEVHSDDESTMGSGTVASSKLNRLFPVSTTVADYADNIIENNGYTITIDTGSASGLTLATTKDYFVVIYADDVKKHHVAKIVEQTQYDGNNYSFEFTPRVKENITVGTKVAIYQGPDKTDNVVAVGYGLLNANDDITLTCTVVSGALTTLIVPDATGLLVGGGISSVSFPAGTIITAINGLLLTTSQDSTAVGSFSVTFIKEERHDKYVEISRPTFYFYSDDKLDHDRKYTLLKTSTNLSGTKKSVFKTAPISSDMIIDKGFFTHNGDLTDNNRNNDNLSTPRGINAYNAQGSIYTFDETTWAGSSKNIYDSDGGLSTYITFIDSPTKNQIYSSPYYVNVNKTVTNKGNLAEIKFFDTERILDKKFSPYERFKVKQFITEKKLDSVANNPLPGTCTKTTNTTFTVSGLVAGEDWQKLLTGTDETGNVRIEPILMEGYYYTISSVGGVSNGSQVITIGSARAITATSFSGMNLPTLSDVKAYRKTWSPVTQTYIAGHQIDTQIPFLHPHADYPITRNGVTIHAPNSIPSLDGIEDSDVNGIEYILENNNNHVFLEVDRGDKDTGYTQVVSRPSSNFFANTYLDNAIEGNLIVNNPIFEGFIESKKANVDNSFKYEIVGRDSINKLLNTSLDKNYVHSEEYVYTTFNPYVGDATSTSQEMTDTSIVVGSVTGKILGVTIDPTSLLSYGDTIAFEMNDDRYVILGVVESTSTDGSSTHTVTLMKDSYIANALDLGSTTLSSLKIHKLRKSIIPSKNLESSPRINNRSTSIVGTLDKGIVFESGNNFGINGDGSLLRLTNESGVESGYNIDDFLTPIVNSDGEYLDFPLGFKTTLNVPASTPEMKIVSSTENPSGTVTYELGYVSPIVLGLVVKNDNDLFINSGSDIKTHPIRLINGQGLPDGGFLHLLSSYKNSDNSPKTFNNVFSDDPAYGSTITSQYAFRYNQPIFRYANMAKTPNQLILQPYSHKYHKGSSNRFSSTQYTSNLYSRNDYYENTKNFNFYLSSYKISRKTVDYDKDNSSVWLKSYPKEQLGLLPALGSRFFDIDRVPTWYYNSGSFFGNRFTTSGGFNNLEQFVGKLELHDPSAISPHLFSLGDVYPESKTNQNNIFYTGKNRNINDYSIIFKKDKTKNNENNNTGYDNFVDLSSPLKVNVSSRKDADYHVEPISNSDGDKIRFNLMRLTDVTLDTLFNDVDYENYTTDFNSKELTEVALGSTSSDAGIKPLILIKSFPQAGLHNVDVKVGSTHTDDDKLNVTSTYWYQSIYKYYIYYYVGSNTYPTYVGLVSSAAGGVITFTDDIDQSVDVTDTVLYVQIHHNEIGTTSKFTKMLLTRDATVPYFPESTEAVKHNYNKTVIFANSNLETANDVFNDSNNNASVSNKILRTPIFKSTLGDTEYVHTRETSTTLATPASPGHFRMQVAANVTGNTITLTDGASKLSQFFDSHVSTVIGVSNSSNVRQMLSGNSSIPSLDATDTNLMTLSTGTTDSSLIGVKFEYFDGNSYTITKIESSTSFRVTNAAGAATHGKTTSYNHQPNSIETATYSDTDGFIEVSGLTASGDNRLYKVSGYTDTVLTLTDIRGNNPSMATENGVTITLTTFTPRDRHFVGLGTGTGGDADDYISTWDTNINGVDEPAVYSTLANNIIPHRAYHETELKIDYGSMDTVVAKFHDIMDIVSEFKPLPPELKDARGAICEHVAENASIGTVGYSSFGTGTSLTQHWNKGVYINYPDVSSTPQGIISNNYNVHATSSGTRHAEKIYGGEIFFKPYIKYASGMDANDAKDLTNEQTLKFDISKNWGSGTTMWMNYCNNLTGYYFYNETDGKLHKIISHEINRVESAVYRHLIKIDNTSTLGANDILRLMRINQVCMYDFSHNRIALNIPFVEYTKVCDADRMQSGGLNATRFNSLADGEGMHLDTSNNGVKSMYVLIDPDGNINTDFLETRSTSDANYNQLTVDSPIRMVATDGVNTFTTSVGKIGNSVIELSEVKKLLGTPSFGSTFNVTVNKAPNFKPDSACIGVSFKVVDEIEKVLDDAFIINNIDYTKNTDGDTYYGAFNFSGQSLYSAANNLLSYKGKEILVDGEEIKIVNKEDDKKYRDIILSSKDSTYTITSISNDISLFDNFDEVIVIGDGVRGIARNPVNDDNSNRVVKSKTIYDYSIMGQRQADIKALQYLDVFNVANTSIEIHVTDNIPFLKPGQIVALEFAEQNIPRGDYLVIESEKEFGSPTKLILSEYNKDLAGTFASLLGEIKNLQGFTSQKVYTSTIVPVTKRDKVIVKLVKATGTLSSSITTTSTIGFGYTIGFSSEVGV